MVRLLGKLYRRFSVSRVWRRARKRSSPTSPWPRRPRPRIPASSPRSCPSSPPTQGIAVRVVAVGTGQALRLARNGDADVLSDPPPTLGGCLRRRGPSAWRATTSCTTTSCWSARQGRSRPRSPARQDAAGALDRDRRRQRAPSSRAATTAAPTRRSVGLWQAAETDPSACQRHLVPGGRRRYGRDPQHRPGHGRLYPERPGDLGRLRQPGRSCDPGRGRSGAVQSLWRDPGQCRAPPPR